MILGELRRRGRHASAQEIYEAVRLELPGTSVPTVYATLELLAELGLARKLNLGVGWALYDARAERHQHVVCRRCGRVEDLDGEFDASGLLSAAHREGFQADRAEVVIMGLCRSCAEPAEDPAVSSSEAGDHQPPSH
ncbi:MAG: transcriptional repressor [Actinomycetota bacterium]|nr:transcriptional repressor [Actinomycetota bacterium]